MVVAVHLPAYFIGKLSKPWIFGRAAEAVRLIIRSLVAIVVVPHEAVAIIRVYRAFRPFDGQFLEVTPEQVSMRTRIADQTSLQHLVRRIAHPRNNIYG